MKPITADDVQKTTWHALVSFGPYLLADEFHSHARYLQLETLAPEMASGNPNRMPRNGAASASSTMRLPMAAGHGRCWTNLLHRYQREVS